MFCHTVRKHLIAYDSYDFKFYIQYNTSIKEYLIPKFFIFFTFYVFICLIFITTYAHIYTEDILYI